MAAGSAFAYVCHPAADGVRMLTLRGAVTPLGAHGAVAELLVRSGRTCSRVSWNTATGAHRSTSAGCRGAAPRRVADDRPGPAALSASSTGIRAVVSRGSLQRPDALRVYGPGGSLLRTLPLPARPRTLALSGGIAVFSATRGDGVYAVRLSDGLFGFLGPDGGSFRLRLDARGVLFHNGESKRALRDGKTVLEFVPRAAVLRTIERTAAPLLTGGPVRALSMDGPRVALAVGDRAGACDRVLYWNVGWRPVQRISAPSGPTCPPRARGVEIGSLSIGGFRTEWLAADGAGSRLVAGSPLCQEWVLGRLGRAAPAVLAGDGGTLAFAAREDGRAVVSVVDARYRPVVVATGPSLPLALAADRGRVAILWPGGTVDVRSRGGRLLARLDSGAATGIALGGRTLVALRSGRLDVFDVASGRRLHEWRVPRASSGVDLQDGIVSLAAGRAAVVVDAATGRSAVVGRAPRPLVGVQIERPGLAFGWTSARAGEARLVTMPSVELALGRTGA